jgi:hypothetical protein
MNEIIDYNKSKRSQMIIKKMPKKYSEFKKLRMCHGDIFREEKLVEIRIAGVVYRGKCFVNEDNRRMYWRPQHQWYVFIDELDAAYSYDLLQDKEFRIIPTEIQLNHAFERKMKEIVNRGKKHRNGRSERWSEMIVELGLLCPEHNGEMGHDIKRW